MSGEIELSKSLIERGARKEDYVVTDGEVKLVGDQRLIECFLDGVSSMSNLTKAKSELHQASKTLLLDDQRDELNEAKEYVNYAIKDLERCASVINKPEKMVWMANKVEELYRLKKEFDDASDAREVEKAERSLRKIADTIAPSTLSKKSWEEM